MQTRLFRGLEFFLLFVLVPGGLVVWHGESDIPFFPVLLGMFLVTLLLGRRDPEVSFRWAAEGVSLQKQLRRLLPRFVLVGLGVLLITAVFYPELLFRLPRRNPRVWMLVMVLYPLLSVAPQEVMFRSFFVPRYRHLFGNGLRMLILNALIFAWAHVFFHNMVAPLLSLVAGALLADTWQKTRDFRLVCIEHALYGQMVFTSGIGWFFYTGSTRAIESLTS
jgi:hypothetical protein